MYVLKMPLLLLLLFWGGVAAAQSSLTRPIRLIVAVPPSGAVDMVARIMAPRLSEVLRQQVVVDNRAGANGLIGAELAAKAPADGLTWLFATAQHTTNVSLVKGMTFDLERDLEPVSLVLHAGYMLVVHPAIPAQSVNGLIDLAKKRPATLNYGSGGIGSAGHLSGELFKTMAKMEMVHVSYKGMGLALSDLIGGHIDLLFPAIVSGMPYHKSGRLRGLGITGPKRHPAAPGVPTISEAGLPGYEFRSWYGIAVPAGTPRETINRINSAIRQVTDSKEVTEILIEQGADPATTSPEEFAKFIKQDIASMARVVRAAGIEVK